MSTFHKVITVLVVLLLAVSLTAQVAPVAAQARTAQWLVSVTYQNVGTGPATVSVNFYAEGDGTAISFNPLGAGTLAAGAGTSFFIGSTSLPSGFRGSAVMSSDQPLVATVVQFSQQADFKMRLLSNGFQSSNASSQYIIPTTLLNRFSRTTVFSIQNTENQAIDAVVRFYDALNAGALASTITHTIPAQSSKYIELDDVNDTGLTGKTTFDGSAIVSAFLSGTSTPANVVSAVSEYYTNRNVATNFEGVPLSAAANNIFMATGLCQRFGLDSFYAVTNASLVSSAVITVTYRNTDGTQKAVDGPYTIGPGQKKSITTCSPSDTTNMASFTGSAAIESSGAPVAVLGRAQNSINAGTTGTQDVFTAFLGESAGTSKRAFPFVRWANDTRYAASTGGQQRAFIAVQSMSTGTNVFDVKYYDKNGGLIATHPLTIAQYAKGNSDPNAANALGQNGMNTGEFGYYTDGTFGGAVVVEANSANPTAQFIAIIRVQNPGAGEDYNAVPIN